MIAAFLASLALAGLCAYLLLGLAYTLIDYPIFADLFYGLNATVGRVPVMVVTGFALFVAFFFLLSHGTIRRIEQLNRAVHRIARGELDVTIPVRTDDELGHLARNLEVMTQQLQRSMDEERRAQQARHELITSVSHDLRTPLTSVLGYLSLIERDRYRDEVELRHYTDLAYAKAQQLQRLVEQLFELTRTSHGGLRLSVVPVNLGELLEQLAEEFVPALEAAGMHYRLTLPEERVTAAVDPDLMVRVLENLVTNAIRYGREGRQVDLALFRDGGHVVVQVANYGEPIPERDLPYLFESFYRVEKSRSHETGGAGLGLAIARNIVLLHGGCITAFNEAGRTVFEVRLPV